MSRRLKQPSHDCRSSNAFHLLKSLTNSFRYNQQSHPLPFMKASNVLAPKKQTKEKPDLEEALEESDEGEVVEEAKDDDEEADLTKDKYVKQPKKKAAAKKAQPQKRGKKRAADDEDEESEEEVKPKKSRGKGKKK